MRSERCFFLRLNFAKDIVTQKNQDPETENISTEEMEEATVLKGKGGVRKNSDRPLRTMLKTRKKKGSWFQTKGH